MVTDMNGRVAYNSTKKKRDNLLKRYEEEIHSMLFLMISNFPAKPFMNLAIFTDCSYLYS